MLGASFDTPAENKAFVDAQNFDFRLLSDVDRTVGEQYEVKKSADEQFPDFPKRIAYLIDPQGVIRKAYEVTDTEGFASEVLTDLGTLT